MRGGPQESDAVFGEQFGELGFLGGVPPAGPHGLHRYALGYVENEVDVSVIVIVGASRNGNIVIGQPNVFSVGLHVLWCHHGVKLDGLIAAKYLVRPATHGAYELDGTDAIIGDENFLDRTLPSERLHELGWRGNRPFLHALVVQPCT